MTTELETVVMCDDPPNGATHIDDGPSIVKWLRLNEALHEYWCEAERRWVTFEGPHNAIRKHWIQLPKNT